MTRVMTVDLTKGSFSSESAGREEMRRFLGGRGLNMRYLARELRRAGHPAAVDPFGPENSLIVGAGLLTGTIAPNAARFNVSAKSPETLGLGDANCGGFFAHAMRKAGADLLVLRRRASKPSYLLIEDGSARLLPADGLWGLGVIAAQDELRARHGPGTVAAVIGPAGEHLVRMAAVFTGRKNTAGRCG
ncbi:MAG TPA: aldehyde ferredoxin oxidoreductase N-terminal domain-containing protein, partial [Anaerolineales bacterium]|nr:aldehyde ferredoxin oxidoreductase N-terminal domain-containing protein [Anaerolineales bacterium]